MARKCSAPPAEFLVGLGTKRTVSIHNPTSASSAPVLLANPLSTGGTTIRANHYVKVVLRGNLRQPILIVGAAPSGVFFQKTITLNPGQTVVLRSGTLVEKFKAAKNCRA